MELSGRILGFEGAGADKFYRYAAAPTVEEYLTAGVGTILGSAIAALTGLDFNIAWLIGYGLARVLFVGMHFVKGAKGERAPPGSVRAAILISFLNIGIMALAIFHPIGYITFPAALLATPFIHALVNLSVGRETSAVSNLTEQDRKFMEELDMTGRFWNSTVSDAPVAVVFGGARLDPARSIEEKTMYDNIVTLGHGLA
jgi:hypothetical protein